MRIQSPTFYSINLFPIIWYQFRWHANFDASLSTVPFQISEKEATKKFLDFETNRYFKPFDWQQNPNALIISDNPPLRKAYLPATFASIHVNSTKYWGQYGKTRYRTVVYRDEKGNLKSRRESYIEWHDTNGVLKPITYNIEHSKMRFYAGNKYPASLVESAIPSQLPHSQLQPFNKEIISANCAVDVFATQSAILQDFAIKNMKNLEEERANAAIQRRHATIYSSVDSDRTSVSHAVPNLYHTMLPFYVLQYPNAIPRFLAAYGAAEVVGLREVSALKVALLGTTCALIASSFAAPGLALGMRIVGVPLFSGIVSVLGTKIIYTCSSSSYQHEVSTRKKMIESIAPTMRDKQRLATTEFFTVQSISPMHQAVALEHYQTLELDPRKKPTVTEIQNAILQKVKETHPDHGGNARRFESVTKARDAFRASWQVSAQDNSQKRFYSSSSNELRLQVKLPLNSMHSPYARQLICAVLDEKDYKTALQLVNNEIVHPDAHDDGENTLLTEAAKRGDLRAVQFAVNELGVSLDTSCDCPCHRTALHYAAKNGHEKIVEFLVQKGASINLITSNGETALDLAKHYRHDAIAQCLMQNGGIQNPGFKEITQGQSLLTKMRWRMFGFNSNERSLLQEPKQKKILDKSSVNR